MAIQPNTPLKKPIWTLVILNGADGFLTYWGLLAGAIEEANPLLRSLTPLTIFMIKVLLSACLASFLLTSLVRLQSRFWRYFLLAVNVLYFGILALHITWLTLVYL
ncbi:DUF5658 family protein [Planococcus sp. ISL-109]|uniref:DUF5658 family protein n=1 Tax=Planococcus sp. ISL-109 TaxID=2819166 RepID=UPI001BEC4A9E|nr:DUF5658 family protein [Planococcus sp. ISL-109]MBT2582908.1 hypothetical protein [Planococcus sp. ISL-109]